MSTEQYRWTPTHDARPRHWPHGAVLKVTAPSSTHEAQQAQWQAFVQARRLSKRMKRAHRTTAPTWANNLRCFVLELQRDPEAVLLTSGCRCPACRTDVRTTVDIKGWPDFNLTCGPRRITRAQRKAATRAQRDPRS